MVKRVLVSVEETMWGRMKARAAESGKTVPEVVGWAFRQYLAGGEEAVPVVEESVSAEPLGPERSGGRPSVAALQALVNAVKPGAIRTAAEIHRERERLRGDESGSQVGPDDDV